jgi:uncharacterized membrane protein YdjX (TVP38/TMEM64 family)
MTMYTGDWDGYFIKNNVKRFIEKHEKLYAFLSSIAENGFPAGLLQY